MKRLISVLLTLALLVTAFAIVPVSAEDADKCFKEGEILYLRIENPADWADNAVLYANFTEYSREDNGGKSVVIAEADPEKYHPVKGLSYDEYRGAYAYTVTEKDAGAAAMRFWRGSDEKLWNCSVVLTAANCAEGLNTAVVTDWTDTGYLDTVNKFDLDAKINLSSAQGEPGEKFEINVTYNANKSANTSCEIFINNEKVSDGSSYDFTPEAAGVYVVTAKLFATHFSSGDFMSKAEVKASIIVGTSVVKAVVPDSLFAHASRGSKDTDAWVRWCDVGGTYYLFLPNSIREGDTVELYSSFSEAATLGETQIDANSIFDFSPKAEEEYKFSVGNAVCKVRFMYSYAESALFVNNTDDFNGMDFFSYLQQDKENFVAATGAYTHSIGTVTDVEIKKMKGRGNTSWNADKKGFNVTLKDAEQIAGMEKCKKFSLISNFQDAAMARNRILYDLSDAVGVPYASDSRMIDLYTNGNYQGTYQLCQKIDVGKNTLMSDISDKDYLDTETGKVKQYFSFVAEIDSSPSDDDFHFSVQNGNNLTIKSPELDADDPNLASVRGNIKGKFNTMFSKLESKAADIGNYIDLDSLAKVYLINELGKNWDSGASSFFLTYKPDKDGVYKFFASPVWDYDNSLGNAAGVERDLRNMGVTDYTLPTGWFSTKKNGYNGPNFLATAAKHSAVMKQVYKVWFEDFVPALDILNKNGIYEGELYSADAYRKIIKKSAEMNYMIWPLVTNTSWIADHSALQNWGVNYTYNEYGQITGADAQPFRSVKQYDQYTFDGQFDYMMDWLTSRAAWISGQYIEYYQPERPAPQVLKGDADFDGVVTILDATAIQRYLVDLREFNDDQKAAADTDGSGDVSIMDATRIQRYLAAFIDEL